jgi:hypothetical protein
MTEESVATLEARKKAAWRDYYGHVQAVGSDRGENARIMKLQAIKASMRYKRALANSGV